MTSWKSADVSAFIPPELSSLISLAQSTTAYVAATLEALQAVISTIPTLPISGFDFASVLILAVEKFKADFLGTGFYACNMWDYPLRQLARSGSGGELFSEFEFDLRSSFTDPADPNVPPFSSDAAMIILVAGAPGLPAITSVMEGLAAAFSWWGELQGAYEEVRRRNSVASIEEIEAKIKSGEIKVNVHPSVQTQTLLQIVKLKIAALLLTPDEVADKIDPVPSVTDSLKEILSWIEDANEKTSPSEYPDWQEISLRIIVPPLPDIVDQVFEPLIDALRSGRDIVKTLEEFIAALELKINQLDSTIDRINSYLAMLDGLISATGIYALYVTTDNGVDGLRHEISTATDRPFEDVGTAFFSGVAIVAGGPSLTPFKNLFGPIGGA